MLTYVVRHAESLANLAQHKGLNDGLSALGTRQVEALVKRFEPAAVGAVYASPFVRCLETALPIARSLGLPVRVRPDLCEHHHLAPGTVADTALDTMQDLADRYPEVVPCPDHAGSFDWVPADESFEAMLARAGALAAYLKDRWRGEDDIVVLISHGSPVARLIEAWLTDRPGPWFRFIIDNCSVSALRFDGGISTLVCLNEASHLAGLPPPAAANWTDDGLIKPKSASGGW